MIVKERKTPIEILRLEALLRRLPRNHLKFPAIEEAYMRRRAGFQGELSLDYFLGYLPEDLLILHDLRLHDGKRYFQIDCLILTSSFVLILEVKNFSGTLIFDSEFNQMIRIINDKEEAFPDPISQVERQKTNLKNWFNTHGFPLLPIETLVLVSNPHTIIKTSQNSHQTSQKVIHSANLITRFERYRQKYNIDKISVKECKKISKLLIKKHEPLDSNYLQQYLIMEQDIVTGVHCTSCLKLKMQRHYGCWQCSDCMLRSKVAHLSTLKDYALLIKPFITNKEVREFLELESVTVASRLLSSMNIPRSGRFKGRKYELYNLLL